MMRRMSYPTPQQRRELAATAAIDERTIERAWREPSRIRESTRVRLTRAALALGIEPPPAPAAVKGAR